MIREEVVLKLVATRKWSGGTARLSERAGYKCEYCGLDLLASVEAYKQFEVDHIVPLSKGGDPASFSNLALSCRHCNFHLKRSWDPRETAGENGNREQLIAAVKAYIAELRQRRSDDLEQVRQIVGWAKAEQRIAADSGVERAPAEC